MESKREQVRRIKENIKARKAVEEAWQFVRPYLIRRTDIYQRRFVELLQEKLGEFGDVCHQGRPALSEREFAAIAQRKIPWGTFAGQTYAEAIDRYGDEVLLEFERLVYNHADWVRKVVRPMVLSQSFEDCFSEA